MMAMCYQITAQWEFFSCFTLQHLLACMKGGIKWSRATEWKMRGGGERTMRREIVV